MSSRGIENENRKGHATSRKKPSLSGIRVQPAQLNKIYPEYEVHKNIERFLVHVYIDIPGGTPILLQDAKVSVRALRTLSPVINSAAMKNGNDEDLDHIALPPGDRQAYLNIFHWLDQVLAGGRPDQVVINCLGQLSDYRNMLHIAESLRIHSMIDDMRLKLGVPLQHTEVDRASCPYCRFSGTVWQ